MYSGPPDTTSGAPSRMPTTALGPDSDGSGLVGMSILPMPSSGANQRQGGSRHGRVRSRLRAACWANVSPERKAPLEAWRPDRSEHAEPQHQIGEDAGGSHPGRHSRRQPLDRGIAPHHPAKPPPALGRDDPCPSRMAATRNPTTATTTMTNTVPSMNSATAAHPLSFVDPEPRHRREPQRRARSR